MPHVELLGPSDLVAFHQQFQRRSVEEEGRVYKATGCFLASDHRSLLIECVTVEGYLRQSFFVLVTKKEQGLMVRLLPRTSPEKSAGVKRCVVWIARWIEAVCRAHGLGSVTIGTTNLTEFLQIPLPENAAPP